MLVPRPTPPPCAKASHPPPGHPKEPRWPTLYWCWPSRLSDEWWNILDLYGSLWYLYMISEMISLWSLGFVSFFAFEAGICNHCEDLQSTDKPQVSWWRQVKPVMQRAPGVFLEDPVESNRQRWCDSGITVASWFKLLMISIVLCFIQLLVPAILSQDVTITMLAMSSLKSWSLSQPIGAYCFRPVASTVRPSCSPIELWHPASEKHCVTICRYLLWSVSFCVTQRHGFTELHTSSIRVLCISEKGGWSCCGTVHAGHPATTCRWVDPIKVFSELFNRPHWHQQQIQHIRYIHHTYIIHT